MGERQILMKCKEFDAWISFIGRLEKVGTRFIMKNDSILAYQRTPIPGKHIIKDPLFIDDEDCYVTDGVYQMVGIEALKEAFKNLKETVPGCRKRIVYFRNKESVGFIMGVEDPVTIEVANLITEETPFTEITSTANSITWFKDLIEPVENMVQNEWTDISLEQLIHLRNNGILEIKKTVGGRTVSTRLARSLFPLSGVLRMDNPLALATQYAFLPSEQSDVSILRLRAIYKCAQSSVIQLDCVHEYLLLIYDEEE